MNMQVFYYRIPYSNGKFHQNRLVLARKNVLFYFFRDTARYIDAKSRKYMYETLRKKLCHALGTFESRTRAIVNFFRRKNTHRYCSRSAGRVR